jgi:colanic acid biosynthesis glycosyl transferase WcaI
MRLVVLTPHFAPDSAPTGAVVTRLVHELAALEHRIEVITALPWYREHRIEDGYEGKLSRHEDTPWGKVTRLHPFPTADKTNIARRAASFVGFTALAGITGRRGTKVDGVLAVSPPLTLGSAGRAIARARGGVYVFNVQDVYPDVAIDLGYMRNPATVAAALVLERRAYNGADAVTVLSEDIQANVARKTRDPSKVRVIPNFVDTELISPREHENPYRAEFGLSGKKVVMYAGNVGLSQSLDLVLAAAVAVADFPDVVFVINGEGAAKAELQERARGLENVVFVDAQPLERLPEVLAAADVHLVPLKKKLSTSSVPSKTFSILAAGRPFVASVDPGSEIARIAERSGGGIAVPPDDPEAFTRAIKDLIDDGDRRHAMGLSGRSFVEGWASPRAVARAYEELFAESIQRSRP